MSASSNVETHEPSAEQIKEGVREVYAARVSGDAGVQCGGATTPASRPERKDLIEVVGYSPNVNSRTLMYQPCAANMYQKNRRTHCETLRLV